MTKRIHAIAEAYPSLSKEKPLRYRASTMVLVASPGPPLVSM